VSSQEKKTAQAILEAYPSSDAETVGEKVRIIVSRAEADGMEPSDAALQLESWTVQLPHRRAGWANADDALVDLKRLLLSSKLRRPVLTPFLQTAANGILRHWLPVASVVTFVVSGFYGLAYAQFYEELDVSPEQAGVTTAQIVAHSVIGGLALTLVISAVAFLILVPLAASSESSVRSDVGTWSKTAANGLIALGAILILGYMAWRTHAPVAATVLVLASTLSYALATSLRIKRKGRRPAVLPSVVEFTLDGYLIVAMFGLALGIVATGLLTYTEAHHLGAKAKDGEAIRNPEILGVPFLGVKAEPTLIAWTGGEPDRLDAPGCALYLGAADGQDLLYDPQTGGTLEVPRDDVVLSLRRDRTTCEAPVSIHAPTVRRVGPKAIRCLPGDWANDAKRSFTYRWTIDGHAFPETFTLSPYLDTEETAPSQIAFCHVKATTPLGADVATSLGISLGVPSSDHAHQAAVGRSEVAGG
jgi:hypothetical protein